MVDDMSTYPFPRLKHFLFLRHIGEQLCALHHCKDVCFAFLRDFEKSVVAD